MPDPSDPSNSPSPTPPPSFPPASVPPTAVPPAPSPAASVPAATIASRPIKSYKGLALTSWILFVVTCLVSIIPVVGFATWLVAIVVIPLIIIFAIITLTRGGTAQGIILIIVAIVVMPTFLLIAPLASTVLLGVAGVAHDKKQEAEIVANLNVIADAKTQWTAQTSAANGAAVTMADVTPYLPGKTVKNVVGESYDPQPVGQAPIATLPANTSLVGRKGGDVITAESASSAAETTATPAKEDE